MRARWKLQPRTETAQQSRWTCLFQFHPQNLRQWMLHLECTRARLWPCTQCPALLSPRCFLNHTIKTIYLLKACMLLMRSYQTYSCFVGKSCTFLLRCTLRQILNQTWRSFIALEFPWKFDRRTISYCNSLAIRMHSVDLRTELDQSHQAFVSILAHAKCLLWCAKHLLPEWKLAI